MRTKIIWSNWIVDDFLIFYFQSLDEIVLNFFFIVVSAIHIFMKRTALRCTIIVHLEKKNKKLFSSMLTDQHLNIQSLKSIIFLLYFFHVSNWSACLFSYSILLTHPSPLFVTYSVFVRNQLSALHNGMDY